MSEMDKDILKEIEKHQEQNFKKKSLDNKTKKNQQKKQNQSEKTGSNYTKKRTRKRNRKNTQKKEIDKKNVKIENLKSSKKELIKNSNTKKKNNKNRKSKYVRKKQKKNKFKIIFVIILSLLLIGVLLGTMLYGYKIHQFEQIKERQEQKQMEIVSHYNKYVKTNKEVDIYKMENNKYIKSGKIGLNQELILEDKNITYKDEYFKISSFDEEYYIYYKDIDIIDNLKEIGLRYKKYLPYNKNIVTKEITNFYDSDNNLVYTFNKSFSLPIIINKKDIYGIEFNNRLLFVKEDDVKEIVDKHNTNFVNTSGIAVLNYHFFYDETKLSERNDCNQIICHSKSGVKKHFEYIKNNNIFTPTMKEFEMYLNKEINLPRSVLITIDDGWRTQIVENLLNEYELNGTIFLITSWFKEIDWLNNSEYIEYHSHGDNLHNQGICPGGQGGAIKCLDKTKLLNDLLLSREKLAGTTAFCYPFYEYNSYSINVLKEAGFTVAFAGGFKKATPNTDKYQVPRYVMYDYTTVNDLASYIN